MNNEPIKFLPVEPFWKKRDPSPGPFILAWLLLGVCIGGAVMALAFVLILERVWPS